MGPFYSAESRGHRSFTALPAILLANSILAATKTHRGYKMAIEVKNEWTLWTNRETFYEVTKESFVTPSTNRSDASRDPLFFCRFFDGRKIAETMTRYGCVFRDR
jgi:hypothetical protein